LPTRIIGMSVNLNRFLTMKLKLRL
jgi:hypothetical protein